MGYQADDEDIPAGTPRQSCAGREYYGKSFFTGTVAWTFACINLSKLPSYAGLGLIDYSVLKFDLLLLPLIPLGSWIGKWMHHNVSERAFNWVIFVLTVLASVHLVFGVNLVSLALGLVF